MFSKKAVHKFGDVPSEIRDKVLPITSHSAMIEAAEKLEVLKKQLSAIVAQIDNFYNKFTPPGSRPPTAEDDAEKIIAGTPIDFLPGQGRDTALKNLIRKREALIAAVKMRELATRQLQIKLTLEMAEKLSPLAREFGFRIISAFQEVEQSLKKQEVFYLFLQQMGYTTRDSKFQSDPYERAVLFGGELISLSAYLNRRRGIFGIEDNK